MEDIDGGLHPAVGGQSLDEDEDEEAEPATTVGTTNSEAQVDSITNDTLTLKVTDLHNGSGRNCLKTYIVQVSINLAKTSQCSPLLKCCPHETSP